MRAKKSLGQHFLMHAKTAARIAESAPLEADEIVLEIGPGTGMLTKPLLARAEKVIALEADHELIPVLSDTFEAYIASGVLELQEIDVRAFHPETITGPYAVVANIPYYITGEIIRQFLSCTHKPRSMTLLVQKEVAERIARKKKEGLLSLSIKVYGTPHYLFTVPRGAFVPAPSVDSAVLQIRDIRNPFQSPAEETRFFSLIHAGFSAKRKRAAKNLERLFPKDAIANAFATLAIDENARAEDISKDSWFALSRIL